MALAVKKATPIPIVIGTFLLAVKVSVIVKFMSMVMPKLLANYKFKGFPKCKKPINPVLAVPLNQ